MTSAKIGLGISLGTMVVFLAIVAWSGPRLPDPVASHFDGRGIADGHLPRTSFLALITGLQLGLVGILIGIGWSIPRLPESLFNLPHKHYWLDPERRADTVTWIKGCLFWMAAATAIFVLAIYLLTVDANLGRPLARLNMPLFWTVFTIYLAVVFVLTGWMIRRFSRLST